MIAKKIKIGDNSTSTGELKGQESELEVFNGDTEEWGDARGKYESMGEI